jgi:hypothetical protein
VATNRVSPYETGWLTFLVERGLATEPEARAAQNRVAQDAVRELERRQAAKRRKKRRRKNSGDE